MTTIKRLRRCTMCREWKTWDQYGVDRSRMLGRAGRCLECERERATANRARRA
jgi:hypothetical protein